MDIIQEIGNSCLEDKLALDQRNAGGWYKKHPNVINEMSLLPYSYKLAGVFQPSSGSVPLILCHFISNSQEQVVSGSRSVRQ